MVRARRHAGVAIGRVRRARAALTAASTLFAAVALLAACGQATGGGGSGPPSSAAAGLTLEVRQDATLGAFVAGEGGKSLYVFTQDSGGASACVDDCAANWPPLVVERAADVAAGSGVTGALATITRPDGTTQVTLGGAPLHYFAADAAAGETQGQGIGGVWFLASPAGGPVGGTDASPGAEQSEGPSSPCSGRYCY
jgi:predicted lipoprotein with Yx(FWY)xxD motif